MATQWPTVYSDLVLFPQLAPLFEQFNRYHNCTSVAPRPTPTGGSASTLSWRTSSLRPSYFDPTDFEMAAELVMRPTAMPKEATCS